MTRTDLPGPYRPSSRAGSTAQIGPDHEGLDREGPGRESPDRESPDRESLGRTPPEHELPGHQNDRQTGSGATD